MRSYKMGFQDTQIYLLDSDSGQAKGRGKRVRGRSHLFIWLAGAQRTQPHSCFFCWEMQLLPSLLLVALCFKEVSSQCATLDYGTVDVCDQVS